MQSFGIFDAPYLRPLGRFHAPGARRVEALPLFWAGSGLEVCFTGTELSFLLEADFSVSEPWIHVKVDGAPLIRMPLNRGVNEICVFRGMTAGRERLVQLYKETQPMPDDERHRVLVRRADGEGGSFLPPPQRACRLEFVGDSLTSGEGVIGALEEESWIPAIFSASSTWAFQTAELLNAEPRFISQSGWGIRSGWDNDPRHALPDWYERVCGPAPGAENLALGAQEPWDFSSWRPDAVIVNLGTNDAGALHNPPWRGEEGESFQQTESPEDLQKLEDAAVKFLSLLRRRNPETKLVWAYGMAGHQLQPLLEHAVSRFREEAGDPDAYFLPLPEASAETMGSRRHPGCLCHQAAARETAAFLKSILH